MVPTRHMKEFLGAVNRLGVKAVVVGDGNQLQPIEAGAAFRSVLQSVNPVSLETIVRQKVAWQRDATQKFGQGKTLEALKMYEERGHIRLRDGLPALKDLEQALAPQNVEGRAQAEIDLYRLRDTARSLKGVAFGQMLNDVERFTGKRDWRLVFEHKDFESRYKVWKNLEYSCKQVLTGHGFSAAAETQEILKKHGQEDQPRLFDVRAGARAEIMDLYKGYYKEQNGAPDADKKTLLFSLSNRDVELLNQEVRGFLKGKGVVADREYKHTIERPYTDPFGTQRVKTSERSFSKGDVVIFLKGDNGLGISNGNRGRVVGVDKQRLQVELFSDDKKTVSFASNLYKSFDHGWATTVYKSQGSDEVKSLYLASPSDTPNLVYVGSTRHREDFQMMGSKEEFGSTENLVSQLSKASEKTLAQDYLQGREPDLKPQESLFKAVSKGFDGLKDFSLSMWSEAKSLKDPYSSRSLETRDSKEVAVDLCSKVLDYWQVRSTEQKETFETDLLDIRSKVEQYNPRALQLFKQAYPDQQKTLWRLEDRVAKETVLENSGTQTTVSPVSEKFYEARELLRGGDLSKLREGGSKALSSPFREDRAPRAGQEGFVSRDEKISAAQKSYSWSKSLDETSKGAFASIGITIDPGSDVRLTQSKIQGTENLIPSVSYFARSSQGEVTGGIKSLIDSKIEDFLKGEGSQRFFGSLKNSFVTLQRDDKETGRTFLTQNPEAALSLKQSGLEGKIVCTLKEENFKDYVPTSLEKTLIICMDREGRDASSFKMLKEISKSHQKEGRNVVEIIPQQPRDTLNNLLQREGSQGVINLLTSSGVSCDRQDWTQILTQRIQAREESPEAKEFRTKVLDSVGVDTYRSWFKDVEIETRDSSLVIQGENAFKSDTLSSKYGNIIHQVCSKLELTPTFEVIGKPQELPQEKKHNVEKVDDSPEKPVLQGAEKDVSVGDEHVQHLRAFEPKEENVLQKTPEEVEQKILEPRDWYAELKGMYGSVDFENAVEDLVDQAKDPAFKVSATNQIHEMLTVSAEERQFSKYALGIEIDNYSLTKSLQNLGVDFRDLENIQSQNRDVLSERARQDFIKIGESSSAQSLSFKFESQLKALNTGVDHYYDEKNLVKSAQDICAVLEGVQCRSDRDDVLKDLQGRHPKAFERIEDLGRTQDSLRESVHKALGRDPSEDKAQEEIQKEETKAPERDRGFDMGR